MRLFIAVNFSEEIKDELFHISDKLKQFSERGSFSLKDNIHLTVIFLGEVENSKIETIKISMDDSVKNISSFPIIIEDIGNFKRNDGLILWLGINDNENLNLIHKNLSKNLSDKGFEMEKRRYSPHLTLGRRVVFKEDFNDLKKALNFPPIKFTLNHIDLMKSERINNRMVYTNIHSSFFK
ncbi:RNA 2',3'-cyclic phosphodiesterase [Sporanaerobacter sp. PP17-6a]|uniref:RNA 2',3'-cyclic phosphodiesterase n=1 Tax=Sporanaerobacter sp. PP17-6a TaxID=1891289 RepID=UPI0008A00419|nr:RNA 2',3'-cyclic phosphodiesterase [Sporanaerobacter sp. PP17-6a]SCL96695.1 2'-5'-RNA ligase [Sporanaerobacter sp. PP17-6a]